MEAAEGVCNLKDELDVFTGIETLLNNSLLRQIRSVSDEPRFDMLQTIRDFALEKVAAAGDMTELRWSHCNYFAQLAGSEMGAGNLGAESVFWLKRYDEEHDNLRLALDWVIQHEEDFPAAMPMIFPMAWFWYRYGYLQEGRKWIERVDKNTQGLGDSPPRS